MLGCLEGHDGAPGHGSSVNLRLCRPNQQQQPVGDLERSKTGSLCGRWPSAWRAPSALRVSIWLRIGMGPSGGDCFSWEFDPGICLCRSRIHLAGLHAQCSGELDEGRGRGARRQETGRSGRRSGY
ncbi:hypothetical protein BRADI_4g00565v3 [Brachypodium distachyon]|uniref:Uncharacterized protein n=1 Tax=Brachypodium distachyon TaxID=15368 RepID=A0A0Q3P9H6_BRADI|nr:hypothetical protein BRADI_4g00565v3 [Brachypodium distachyon]